MILSELDQLLAERGTLQRLLADIPEGELLTRGSFLARLEDVEDRIAALGPDHREPARARLTFRGRPVVGGRGIMAHFGMKATSELVEAVTAMAAALSGPLGTSGPLPNRDQNRLLITGTAVGSFGFDLEEYREEKDTQVLPGFEDETNVARALRLALDVLEGTRGTDDELADAVTEIDPRARAAVRTFLDTLVTNDASFALDVGGTVVRFEDVHDVRRSLIRLGQDNVREEQESLEGSILGVLPIQRTFELRLADTTAIVTGKVGSGIADPDALNDHRGQPARMQVTAIRVGKGRPRYVLNELPEWLELPAQQSQAAE